MTNEIIQELIERIHSELDEIPRVLARMHEGWERARRANYDYYLDGMALDLHGFYMGIERILTRIAETIDGKLPQGEGWHFLLLQQMMKEVPGIRPTVVSTATGTMLYEQHKFRHIVRNVYTYNFDPIKLGKLVNPAPELFTQAKTQLLAFATFLKQQHHYAGGIILEQAITMIARPLLRVKKLLRYRKGYNFAPYQPCKGGEQVREVAVRGKC